MQQRATEMLPAPDVDSADHSARVVDYIRRQIDRAGGAIGFAEYMHHALYAPGLGYYAAGNTKFGEAGDFVTAPEISGIFGRVLARQCAPIIEEIDGADILELGAGSGRLAVDLLHALADLGSLPGQYRIVEVSSDLAERQQLLLQKAAPKLCDRVVWLDDLPEEHTGIIIANEVLDALPVERFVRRRDSIRQICVTATDDGFAFAERDAPASLETAVLHIEGELGRPLPEGFRSELCLAAPQWIADLSDALVRGVVFLFDYGLSRSEYYAADRSDGWLRCHFRHHAHDDPLILAGIQDLTAWVDFTAAASAAHDAGLEVAGYVSQAQFLIGGGLDAELADMVELPPAAQLRLSQQVKLLTLPGEMGENFKCLGLTRGTVATPGAFLTMDRSASL